MTLAQLREMASPGYLETPQRPAFHLLILGTGGRSRHTVDFRDYPIEPGRAVWVRPGQVQRFDARRATAGELVLFRPDFLIPGTRAEALAAERFGPVGYGPAGPHTPGIDAARRALRDEHDAALGDVGAGVVVQTEALRHLLSVLILRLATIADDGREPGAGDTAGLYGRFRDLLERDFAVAHDVGHYARVLGYSTRTMSRATRAAAGQSPKQMIQERLALEAGRLLAHSTQPVGAIAAELGFCDASNFAAFFTGQTGAAPSAFRDRERG
jgi:AraC-like DNA-binding protein